jgi:hypothetical protein
MKLTMIVVIALFVPNLFAADQKASKDSSRKPAYAAGKRQITKDLYEVTADNQDFKSSDNQGKSQAFCAKGDMVITGGCSAFGAVLVMNYPELHVAGDDVIPNGWNCVARNLAPEKKDDSSPSIIATAVCQTHKWFGTGYTARPGSKGLRFWGPLEFGHIVLAPAIYRAKSGLHRDYSPPAKGFVKPSAKKSMFFRLIFLEGSFEMNSFHLRRRRIYSEFSQNLKSHDEKNCSNPL